MVSIQVKLCKDQRRAAAALYAYKTENYLMNQNVSTKAATIEYSINTVLRSPDIKAGGVSENSAFMKYGPVETDYTAVKSTPHHIREGENIWNLCCTHVIKLMEEIGRIFLTCVKYLLLNFDDMICLLNIYNQEDKIVMIWIHQVLMLLAIWMIFMSVSDG